MAQQPDIQYVTFYDGSAARKAEYKPKASAAPIPKRRRPKPKTVPLDPIGILGIGVSAVLLIAMLVGIVQYNATLRQTRELEAYITQLTQENQQLQDAYRAGYDLEQIREMALAMGLVPIDQVENIPVEIHPIIMEQPPQEGFWESIATFLSGLFA